MELMPAETSFYKRSQQMTIHQYQQKRYKQHLLIALGTKLQNVFKNVVNTKIMLIFSRPGLKCSLCNSGDHVYRPPILRCGAM